MTCPNFDNCVFLKANEKKEDLHTAMKGIEQKYCNQHYEECKIYKLSQEMDMNKIPANLMPKGVPLLGTDESNWPQEIKDRLREMR
ncbi:MAG: hypothetical protein ACOCQG_02890 [Candidatus Nanoarchaeia archaeon]